MAPAFQLRCDIATFGDTASPTGEAARVNRPAWRHGHFAPKSAPQHRDFGAGKVGLIK
jgi:hypothetical protein